jgi:RND family efflux transporter MFP subunit
MNMHNKLPDPETANVYPFATDGNVSTVGERPRWLKPLLIGLAIAAVAFGLWKAFGPKPVEPPKVSALPQISVMVPGATLVADVVTAPGSIAARRDAAVGVQGEGGRVTQVLVDAGQAVGKGQVLARIDDVVQVQQSAQLAASVRSAEADARLAQANLARAEALVARGFISKADIDQRTATRDGAVARVAVAKAQLAENNARIERLQVRAPAAGLVLARSVEVGQVVSPSAVLFRLAEGGTLEMRAQVAEQDMERLRAGMTAVVTPLGSTTEYRGKIWLIDPVIDVASRQGIARIALAYEPGLRVGAFAKTRIEVGENAKPVLPQSAVMSDDKGNYVFVIGAENRVERRNITTGTVGDQGVSIATGLNGTEKVVVSAGAFLRPGEKVAPVVVRTTR